MASETRFTIARASVVDDVQTSCPSKVASAFEGKMLIVAVYLQFDIADNSVEGIRNPSTLSFRNPQMDAHPSRRSLHVTPNRALTLR